MSKFIINIIFLLSSLNLLGQNVQSNDSIVAKDSTKILNNFNIRLGFDIGNYIAGKIQNNPKTGFFIDSNIYKNYWLCVEYGNNKELFDNEIYKFQVNGNYFKLGVDYNIYDNWPGMNNQISLGLHYGHSNFSGTLISYKVNQVGNVFPDKEKNVNRIYPNIYADWLEISGKLQVELFNNIYLGYNLSLKYLLYNKKSEDYEIPFIPGFYKVNSIKNFGFGMQYFISYKFGG